MGFLLNGFAGESPDDTIDHADLQGRTTADAHPASAITIADAGAYFATATVEGALQELGAGGIGGGVTDHGALTGLSDDDHAQYHNDARGDARYYTQAQADTLLGAKAASVHTHAIADTTGLQDALDGKQPLDSDLTTIAALDSGTSAGVMATEASGWVKRTYAQIKTSLGLVKADVGLGNVDNTSDANKPVSTAQQTALDAKQNLDSDLTSIAALTPSNDDIIQRKGGVWTNRTMAQLGADLGTGVTDHGMLTGLTDDDHPQYLPRSEAEYLLSEKSDEGHAHDERYGRRARGQNYDVNLLYGGRFREAVGGPGLGSNTTTAGVAVGYAVPIQLYAGDVVTDLTFVSNAAAGTPTHWWFALYDTTEALLAQTNDQVAAAWGSGTAKKLALQSNVTIKKDGIYFAVAYYSGTSSLTWYGSSSLPAAAWASLRGVIPSMAPLGRSSTLAATGTAPADLSSFTSNTSVLTFALASIL